MHLQSTVNTQEGKIFIQFLHNRHKNIEGFDNFLKIFWLITVNFVIRYVDLPKNVYKCHN